MIRLKTLTLQNGIIQSPMAGCTDLAFRLIAREHGMEFAFLEMVSSETLVRKNPKTTQILKTCGGDRPLGAQIFGAKPEVMGEAAGIIEHMGFDLVDINLGCPAPKVTGSGGGSALLKDPRLARKIFKSVVGGVSRLPVTVKMRLGFQDTSGREAIRVAKIAEDCGLDAVAVHGRTRAQGYTGPADWGAIAKVKKAVRIPVIGNGDIRSGEDARRFMEQSACDGVMIGRGALGNPWIYESVRKALGGIKPDPDPSLEEKKRVLLKHFQLEIEHEGPRTGLLKMRRIACWYFKNIPGSSLFRGRITQCTDPAKMREIIESFGLDPARPKTENRD